MKTSLVKWRSEYKAWQQYEHTKKRNKGIQPSGEAMCHGTVLPIIPVVKS